jgi:hypothetical protein
MQRCRTCGGLYPERQPDGTRYFHACAPVFGAIDKDGNPIDAATATAKRAAGERVTEGHRPPPNARDENVVAAGVDATGRRLTRAKADGTGAEQV